MDLSFSPFQEAGSFVEHGVVVGKTMDQHTIAAPTAPENKSEVGVFPYENAYQEVCVDGDTCGQFRNHTPG